MRIPLIVLILLTNVFALEVMINSGIESKKRYSVLHIKSEEKFNCKELKDGFGETTEVICLFSKIPSNKFSKSENMFFKIFSESTQNGFVVRIRPKHKIHLYPKMYDIKGDAANTIEQAQYDYEWNIIGFEENIPYLQEEEKPKSSINFPISIPYEYPRVGAVDVVKRPLFFEEGRDVPLYLKAKNFMENEQYEEAIYEIDGILEGFENTIFKRELLLNKLRALHKIATKDDFDDIVELAKVWVKNYPSDDHVAEVLLILADTYANMGFSTESKYYFDRIFLEHEGEKFEKLAKVYDGDQYMQKGNTQKALDRYKEALDETQDIEIASIAATRLGEQYLQRDNPELASEYYKKVVLANPEFMLKNKDETFELVKTLFEKEQYEVALMLVRLLFDNTARSDEDYSDILRYRGMLEDEAGNIGEALDFYERFLAEFSLSRFRDEVQERLDRLKFASDEDNISRRVEHLDYLMDEYSNSPLSNEAFLKKVEILFEDGNYSEVLNISKQSKKAEDNITVDIDNYIKRSAQNIAKEHIKEDNCKESMTYVLEYNLSEPFGFDRELYSCAFNYAFYDFAKEVAKRNLDNLEDKNFEEKIFWLKAKEESAFKNRECDVVMKLIDDIISLGAEDVSYLNYHAFECSKIVGDEDMMVEYASRIKEQSPKDLRNLSVFKEMVQAALKRNDNLMAINYSEMIMEIQNDKNSTLHTPWVEFTAIDAYSRAGKEDRAIEISKELLEKDISGENRIRALYLQGTMSQKLGDINQSRAAFQRCVDQNTTSPWKNLCADGLKIVDF